MDEIITPATRMRLQRQQRLARELLGRLRDDARGDTNTTSIVDQLDAVLREHSSLVDAILDVVTPDVR